ncbi:phenylalanine--tRNA ligase subunit beta [Aestuariimicrobium ganziense]|uniref:phenylalanine--tRNA ligase subunit beta n=1 Tax=Aestuariimicrobium ganziense TaxID=2773677 RepID=UPI0019450ACB|nr:phenylalanine--tRNA ligase subunit beta [Aestuariimicrobium ganziense]
MRAPMSWLRDWAQLGDDVTVDQVAEQFTRLGLTVERIERVEPGWSGPVVVGRVLECAREPQKNGRTISWCLVDVGHHNADSAEGVDTHRGIVCGAPNVDAGQLVVVALPGAVLPGDFAISARKTYGHVSDGMICAEDELGVGTDHTGIMVLPETVDGRALVPGEDATPLLVSPDTVFDIDVTPDLSHCMSIRGLARELAGALGAPFTDPVSLTTPDPVAEGYPVRLLDAACPLFVAVTVDDLNPTAQTPAWMKRRLELAGMRSISLAVDVTNYVMLETGQPLHAYDGDRLQGSIVVRKAHDGEVLTTLDEQERTLDPDDLLITDDSGPIGVAGVMGGASAEVTETTRTIVLEAAHFDAATISRGMRRHKLPSEASKRFERGVDPGAAYSAAHRAADLLVSLGGARKRTTETVTGKVPVMPTQTIAASLAGDVLGVEVPTEQVVSILQSSGVQVDVAGDRLHLVPPTWRPDLVDPYDYVEEVGCKVGYDHIPSVVPRAPVGRGLTRSQRLRRAINTAVAGQGLVELITMPFINDRDLDRMGLPAEDPRRRVVRLANPLADTAPYLRTSLLPGLFAAISRNTSRGNDDLALYEAGSVFLAREGAPTAPSPSVDARPSDDELAQFAAALPEQPRLLAAVSCGAWTRPGWRGAGLPADWTTVVAAADAAAEAVGVTLVRRQAEVAPWHPGRCAELLVDGQVVGVAGELHPSVCQAFGLPARTAAMELDLDDLIAADPGRGVLAPLSSHPVAKEDVALVVDADVAAEEVRQALVEGGGAMVESVTLFDVYTGPQVGEGKKSLAFALRIRAADHTLKDAEAAQVRDAAVAVAVERFGAVLRD